MSVNLSWAGDLLEGDLGMVDASLVRRYLLGDLSSNEQTAIEDQCFTDGDRFEEFVAAENDLIDTYVRGGLSQADRQLFEQQYANSPRRQRRVDFARSFHELVGETNATLNKGGVIKWWPRWKLMASPYGWPRMAVVGASFVVMAAVSVWALTQNLKLRSELHQASKVRAELQQNRDTLVRRLAGMRKAAPGAGLGAERQEEVVRAERPLLPGVSLTLAPGLLRDGSQAVPTLFLPLHGSTVLLHLIVEADGRTHKTYEAVVQTAKDQAPLFADNNLKLRKRADDNTVALRVPSWLIRPGDFIVNLAIDDHGTKEEVGSYTFRVLKSHH